MFVFEKAVPESVGVSSAAVTAFFAELDKLDAVHSVMLTRHDKLIAEVWWKPFKKEYRHELFSCSKSFVSVAFGIACNEGLVSLDDKLVSFFPDKISDRVSERMKKVTMRNLLTMASGHKSCPFSTRSIAYANDWVRGFLESELAYEPGTKFVYNSAATYMLSAVLRRVCGKNVLDYLNEKVFSHIGIVAEKWDCCPDGTNIGGWGLWLKTEDMLRFGRLLLKCGNWDGKQLVPAEYLAEATSFQIDNSSNEAPDWKLGYGYQFWRTSFNSFRCDGACGQYILVMPEYDLCMAVTSGVSNMQRILTAFWNTVVPSIKDDVLTENRAGFAKMCNFLSNLEHVPLASKLRIGKSSNVYEIEENRIGLNTFGINFDNDGCELLFTWNGGKNEKLRADYGKYSRNFLQLLEDCPRIIEASAAWINENELAIQVWFVETPYRDCYFLTFENDGITLKRDSLFTFLHPEFPVVRGKIKNNL